MTLPKVFKGKEKFSFKKFITNPKNIILILEAIFFIWFVFAFLLYPNINLFWDVLFGGNFVSNVKAIMSSQRALKSIGNSFLLAISMCVTVNIVGTFVVLITEYFQIHGAKVLRLGYMSTMIYSGMILVSGYKFLYGEVGLVTKFFQLINPETDITWFQGYGAVLFIMTFACTTNHVIFLRNAIHQIDYQTIEAARNMGAGSAKILFKVVLPTLAPSFLSITILTFITGLSATSAPLLVGGTGFQSITTMVITFAKIEHTRSLGALLAIFLGLVTLVLLAFMNWFERRGHYMSISKVKTTIVKQKIKNPVLNVLMHVVAYVLFVIYVAPIVMIVLFSFTDAAAINLGNLTFSAFTFENYRLVLTNLNNIKPMITSILLSGVSITLMLILVMFACRLISKYKKSRAARTLEYMLLLPWLLPAILISVGLLQTFIVPQWPIFGITLGGTVLLVVVGYIINNIPYSLRMTRAAFYSIDNSLEDAAKNLGAGGFYTFIKVLLPIIVPTMLALWAIEFNKMLGEYDISVLLAPSTVKTLGMTIQELTTDVYDPNAKAISFVYAVIMMVISSLVVYFVYGRKSLAHNNKSTLRLVKKIEKMRAAQVAQK